MPRASHAQAVSRWLGGIDASAHKWTGWAAVLGLGLQGLVACAPAMDWRTFQPEGLPVTVAFPCRPDRAVRGVTLAGLRLEMTLLSCEAAGRQFALLSTQVATPDLAPAVLRALTAAAQANLRAEVVADGPASVPGMTPLPQARRTSLSGRGTSSQPLHQQLAVFSYGAQVFQAAVLGPQLPAGETQVFFEALQVRVVPEDRLAK